MRERTTTTPWRRMTRLPLLLAASAALAACGGDRESDDVVEAEGWQPTSADVRGVPLAAVRSAIGQRVADGAARPASVTEHQWARVRQLYETYADAPLFLDADGIADRGRAVAAAVAAAHEHALRADGYPIAELRAAVAAAGDGDASAERLAVADVMLAATYVAYAEDMLTGQLDPREVSTAWHIDPNQIDVDSAVARSLRSARFDQALAALAPQDGSYALLRRELQRYRELAARGGWQPVPGGAALRPGDRAPAARLAALERRLAVEGLLDGDQPAAPSDVPTAARPASWQPQQAGQAGQPGQGAGGGVYDDRLAGAVAAFQARHGIVVDSILGAETVASLNLPADYRLAQIAANLERHRWLPRSLGQRYILVNVPAFQLHAYDGGRETLTMNVVVGAEFDDQSTPTFADSMSFIVFRPYWNVPDNIAQKEIYPKAAADPGYFAAKNYEHVTENGRTWVRQTPGDHNSLGLVKFMFPNEFAIYLHDTPDRSTFEQDIRAASHGCIRLERPEELARFVLGWDDARIRDAMTTGPDDQTVHLDRKIPVYIAYFTAYARDDRLYFGNDVYDRDRDIVARVAAAAAPDAATAREIAALREVMD